MRHDSPDLSPKRARHDSPDLSPQRTGCHDSPDLSPQTHGAENISRQHDSLSPSPPRKSHKSSPSRTQRPHDKGTEIYPQIRNNIYTELSGSKLSVISESPHRKKTKATSSDDLSPPRRRVRKNKGKGSDSDQSPPRRRPRGRRGSDSDLSPPRRESRVEEIQISLLPGGGHRGDVDQTQTVCTTEDHALLTDRQ